MLEVTKNIIEYKKVDFIYDNGLVNAFMYLEGSENSQIIDDYTLKWNDITVELRDYSLVFHVQRDEKDLLDIYKFLMEIYYNEIMESTGNKRLYVVQDLTDIIEGDKINKKPFAGRIKIDKLQDIYGVREISGDDFIKLATIYENKIKSGEIKKEKFWHGYQKKSVEELMKIAKEGNTIKVDIYHPISEIKRILSNYVISAEKSKKSCSICGSPYTTLVTEDGKKKNIIIESRNMIYDFGNSTPVNRDHRMQYEQPICFMCDMFYKLGMLNNYFYNNSVFMFSSSSLRTLKEIKERLGINNEYDVSRDDKIKTNIAGNVGIPIYGIYSQILGVLYHIYKKIKDREKLIYDIGSSMLIKFDISTESVDNSIFYTKLSKVFQFFKGMEREGLCCGVDSFLNKFMRYLYDSRKDKKEYPKVYEEIGYKLLYFLPVENPIFEAWYGYLLKEKEIEEDEKLRRRILRELKKIGKFLEKFLEMYKKLIGGDYMEYKEILDKCSSLGEQIGYYAAEMDEKNLIHQIREIGNDEKIVEFFRDFEYSVLKNDRGDILSSRDETTGKKYSEIISEILALAENKENVPLIRDLLGIFAVQKYLTVKFAKSKGGD